MFLLFTTQTLGNCPLQVSGNSQKHEHMVSKKLRLFITVTNFGYFYVHWKFVLEIVKGIYNVC